VAFRPDTGKSVESFFKFVKSSDVDCVFRLLNFLSQRFVNAADDTNSSNSLSISSSLLASSFDFMVLVVFTAASFRRLYPSFGAMLGVGYSSAADCHFAVPTTAAVTVSKLPGFIKSLYLGLVFSNTAAVCHILSLAGQ